MGDIKKNKIKKRLYIIKKIENVRKKNNVNWMNILRIAYTYAPEKTNNIIKKINKDDSKISKLLTEVSKN